MKHKYTIVRMALLMALLVAGLTVAAVPGAAQSPITSATLHIFSQWSNDTTAEVHVHPITGNWTETEVTWNTRPTYDASVASFYSGFGWLSVDLTALVQAWVAGAPNYGVLLEQDQVGYTMFSSRESAYNPPYLEVCTVEGCQNLPAIADAFVFAILPDLNGNPGALYTGVVGGYLKESLILFDIPEIPCGEGCTPGYWKNHVDSWSPTGYSPVDDFDTVFGVDYFSPDIDLLQAVNLGGGGVNVLARHGAAALLSAAHPDVDYPYTVAEVIAFVQAGDAASLVEANELGCPID